MGKARKKKQKAADFQKVKLKVGKKKPVGTNVTNTAFKTSTINIASQLEKGIGGPTNKKQLSLKELLVQLNHYNVTVRHDALIGLHELFQMHSSVIHDNIGIWLSKVFEKMTDTDAAVRHASHLCLNYSFNQLESSEVLPFIKIIVAHLCCGMTHINSGVQLDMLNILDVILTNYPKLFVQHCTKILTHFMDLISKQTSKEKTSNQSMKVTKVKSISSMVSRELSVDVQSQLSSLKVRSQVLEKLHKILKVFYDYGRDEDNENKLDDSIEVMADRNSRLFVPLPNRIQEFPSLDMEAWLSFSETEKLSSDKTFGDLNVNEFIQCVFPVLLNSWVEYEPGQLASSLVDSNSLRTSLPGMKAIIEIIDILLQLLHENKTDRSNFMFNKEYFKDLSSHFLHYFALPVVKSKTKSINGKAKSDPLQVFAIQFNFVMSQLVCDILLEKYDTNDDPMDTKLKIRYVKQLVVFVMDIMDNNVLLNEEKAEQFMNIFKCLILMKTELNAKEVQSIDVSNLLKHLVKNFTKASVSSPWKIPIIHFVQDILTDATVSYIHSKACTRQIEEFLKVLVKNVWSLPCTSMKLIYESISFIKILLISQKHHLIDEGVLTSTIIKLTELPNGLFCNVDITLQRMIVEIIYNMNMVTEAVVKHLALLCQSTKIKMNTKKYIISVLGYCVEKRDCSLEKESFLNFILSIVLGYSKSELLEFSKKHKNPVSWQTLNIVTTFIDDEIVEEKGTSQDVDVKNQYVIEQLKFFQHHRLWLLLLPSITKLLTLFESIPLRTSHGLVKLLEKYVINLWRSIRKRCHLKTLTSKFRLTTWYHEVGTNSTNTFTAVDFEIFKKLNELISALLLRAYSATFKLLQQQQQNDDGVSEEEVNVEMYQVTIPCLNLLAENDEMLKCLVKTYVNMVKEKKSDSSCVVCIMEVLLALLQETRLQTVLQNVKDQLLIISTSFDNELATKTTTTTTTNSTAVKELLLEQYKLHVSLLTY